MQFEMQFDVGPGVTLHVEELGSGPPVVMLHGLLIGNMTTWYWHAAPALAKRHRVILFDLRGHGMSTRPRTGYDLDTMSRDLEAVVDKLAKEPCAIVGHSYGAAVALTFALRAPARVKKLLLVEAPLPPSHLAELDGFLHASPDAMLAALPEELRAVVSGGGRRAKKFLGGILALAQETTLLEDLRHSSDIANDTLATLDVPTLAVYGTRSSLRNVGARLAAHVKSAKLAEIDAGHFLPLEAPHALTPILENFLENFLDG